LVLPTLVLGGLLWRQLLLDHETMLATVPGGASDAATRLAKNIQDQVDALLRVEEERPFIEYRINYFPPGTLGTDLALVPSPLRRASASPEILGWFSFT